MEREGQARDLAHQLAQLGVGRRDAGSLELLLHEAQRWIRVEQRELDARPARSRGAPEIRMASGHQHRDAGERRGEICDERRRRRGVDVVDVDERPLRPQDLCDGPLVDSCGIDPRLLREHAHPPRHRPGMRGIDHHVPVATEPVRVPRVELLREIRLADARHPLDRDDRDAPLASALQRGIDPCELGVAADEDLVPLRLPSPDFRVRLEQPAALVVVQPKAPAGRVLVEERVVAPEVAARRPPAETDRGAQWSGVLVEHEVDHLTRIRVAMLLVALVQAPRRQDQELVVGPLEHVGGGRVLVAVEQEIDAIGEQLA